MCPFQPGPSLTRAGITYCEGHGGERWTGRDCREALDPFRRTARSERPGSFTNADPEWVTSTPWGTSSGTFSRPVHLDTHRTFPGGRPLRARGGRGPVSHGRTPGVQDRSATGLCTGQAGEQEAEDRTLWAIRD